MGKNTLWFLTMTTQVLMKHLHAFCTLKELLNAAIAKACIQTLWRILEMLSQCNTNVTPHCARTNIHAFIVCVKPTVYF